MEIGEILARLREHQDVLAQRYGVAVVGVFGSYVFGARRNPKATRTFWWTSSGPSACWNWWGWNCNLSEVLGVKMDLVPRRSLRPELRGAIVAEMMPA